MKFDNLIIYNDSTSSELDVCLGVNPLKLILCRQSASRNQSSVPNHAKSCSLLEKTCDLIKKFPEYFDVVVSVARKTDGRHWADLFSAAGRSTEYVILYY